MSFPTTPVKTNLGSKVVDDEGTCQSPQANSSRKETKRQQILAIATKEEEDYRTYKESKRLQNVSETPSAAGGCVPREEVLRKLENDIKSSKYRAKVKRDNYKEEQKMTSEQEVNKKKLKAREQAEKNELVEKQRQEEQKVHNAEELRKSRLKYFDKSSDISSTSSLNTDNLHSNVKDDASTSTQCLSQASPSIICHPKEVSDPVSPINRKTEIHERIDGQLKHNTKCSSDDDEDDILRLIKTFPDIDVQLLNDVFMANNYDLQKTINFLR